MIFFWILFTIFLLNLPFGYWRANVPPLSLQWFLAVHIPVPFIILMRIYSDIGFEFYTYPLFIGVFFLGQFSGKKLFEWRDIRGFITSSCLVMDIYRNRRTTR